MHSPKLPLPLVFILFLMLFFLVVVLDLKPDDVRNSRSLGWEMMAVRVKRMKESGSLRVEVKLMLGFC